MQYYADINKACLEVGKYLGLKIKQIETVVLCY